MTSVAVDLADLETLVMTTGALKVIEGALQARKADPFVREHLDFTAAHDRLATAMRNAMRASADTLVPWDGELSPREIDVLGRIDGGEETVTLTTAFDAEDNFNLYHKPTIDSLMAKGMIGGGKYLSGVLWDGDSKPLLSPIPSKYAVRITQRGRQKLAALDAKKPEVVT